MLQRMNELKAENERLVKQVSVLTGERDEARRLAEEIGHMLTYTAE